MSKNSESKGGASSGCGGDGRAVSFVVPIKVFGKKEKDRMKYSLNKVWSGGPGSQWLRKSKAQLWHDEVNLIIDKERIVPFKEKVNLDFKYIFRMNSLDTSNCAVMSKLIEDALVRKGVILGDENDKVGVITTESVNIPLVERRKLDGDSVIVTITSNG